MNETKIKIFETLKALQASYPDLRFCQLISNLSNGDDFYVRDEIYLKRLQSALKNGFPIDNPAES